MREVKTFEVKIFVGLREGYSDIVHDINALRKICQDYVNDVGLCVTVTPTEYIYRFGNEPGAIVGLINYPRFPNTEEVILGHAIGLAEKLKFELNQHRVSVMTPDKTYLIGD